MTDLANGLEDNHSVTINSCDVEWWTLNSLNMTKKAFKKKILLDMG